MQDIMSTLTYKHEDGETTLINQTKNGQGFVNKVNIGPLQDDVTGEVTHFVGLLSEIMQGDNMVVEKEQNQSYEDRLNFKHKCSRFPKHIYFHRKIIF